MLFRPSSPKTLTVSLIQQRHNGECLAACAAMLFAYHEINVRYRQLLKLLQIERDVGVPFSQIEHLRQLRMNVEQGEYGTLEQLYDWLSKGQPIITAVQTNELPHWRKDTLQHAVVVVGMDSNSVYLNDPGFHESPIQVPIGDFDLAWLEQDERYAVLMLAE